jgi:hypothetical protein
MKKITIALSLVATLTACKKDTSKVDSTTTETYFIRVEEVDNDGNTTLSPTIIVKTNK